MRTLSENPIIRGRQRSEYQPTNIERLEHATAVALGVGRTMARGARVVVDRIQETIHSAGNGTEMATVHQIDNYRLRAAHLVEPAETDSMESAFIFYDEVDASEGA